MIGTIDDLNAGDLDLLGVPADLESGYRGNLGGASASLSKGHNSDKPALADEENGQRPLPFKLSGSQAKTAYALRQNAERMICPETLCGSGMLTLTIGNRGYSSKSFVQVWDAAEASRRINNLNRHVLPALFERAIIVTERHKSGAIHFHILGVLRGRPDIRTGFDFEAVKRGDYSSVCPALRRIWALLRRKLPGYGFGRAELTPIKKTGEAVASYVSKYIEKNIFNRRADDRRKKLVRYLGWNREQLKPNEFSWATPRACAWRRNAAALAGLAGVRDRREVADCFGPRWAFRLSRVMNAVAGNDREPCEEISASYAVREATRTLVHREAQMRWVRRRRLCDGRQPGNGWRWKPLRQRLQKTFAMIANNERNQ